MTPDLSKSNRLLAGMPRADRARLLAACVPVELELGEVLAEPGQAIGHVHFPMRSFVSMVAPMGRSCIEVALIGNEGMTGLPLALGVAVSNFRALVQGAGPALRMTAARFRAELARSEPLRKVTGRYAFVSISQLGQAAGCNRFHVVEARLARWLLMTADRAHSASFFVTHEFLAFMLGVRRVGITRAASSLQERGLIRYARGNVTIIERAGLEAAACACYGADLATYEKVLG